MHTIQHRPCNLQRPFATTLLHVKALPTLPKANKVRLCMCCFKYSSVIVLARLLLVPACCGPKMPYQSILSNAGRYTRRALEDSQWIPDGDLLLLPTVACTTVLLSWHMPGEALACLTGARSQNQIPAAAVLCQEAEAHGCCTAHRGK